jgi:beta-1,4-mannooligosaccharide/beta-1,4-mannosyl-N-acetylglucosamine phosphorylase
MKPIFNRSQANPILTVLDMPFTAEAVLNPGAAEHNGEVFLLLRVEDTSGYSSIYVARSRNGVTDWKIEAKPLLKYGEPRWPYEKWGCEDARVTFLVDEGRYYIAYTAYSPAGAAVGLAKTKDFSKAERIGLIMSPNNKDACLFPERFKGKWALLHRPDAGGGVESIWIAYSPDLVHWGNPRCVLPEGKGAAWDALRVGAGPPPIRTQQGWLLLYHGVKGYAGQLVYRVGAALLDIQKPYKVIARSPKAIFKSTELYESTGLIPNVVFPTGMLMRGEELWVYYGAADTCVCLATVKLKDVLNALEEEPDTAPETT